MNKIFNNIGLIAFAVVVSVSLWSCSDDEMATGQTVNDATKAETVEVPVNLGGEIETYSVPLTRADEVNGDLYAVSVYGTNGLYYAYGVFDKATFDKGLTVTLDKNATYNIYATMIVDAKDKILKWTAEDDDGNPVIQYRVPFRVREDELNYFRYDSFEYGSAQTNRAALSSDGTYHSNPSVDRYYGEQLNYDPNSGEPIQIDMQRVSFEMVFNVSGLAEGDTLTLSSPNSYSWGDIVITSASSSFIFSNLNFYKYEGYQLWCQGYNLTWTDKDGKEKDLNSSMKSTGNFRFQRLKRYTFNITLTENAPTDASVSGITCEEAEMTDGDTYTLDADNGLTKQTESSNDD